MYGSLNFNTPSAKRSLINVLYFKYDYVVWKFADQSLPLSPPLSVPDFPFYVAHRLSDYFPFYTSSESLEDPPVFPLRKIFFFHLEKRHHFVLVLENAGLAVPTTLTIK